MHGPASSTDRSHALQHKQAHSRLSMLTRYDAKLSSPAIHHTIMEHKACAIVLQAPLKSGPGTTNEPLIVDSVSVQLDTVSRTRDQPGHLAQEQQAETQRRCECRRCNSNREGLF